jgi:hypothetical protein
LVPLAITSILLLKFLANRRISHFFTIFFYTPRIYELIILAAFISASIFFYEVIANIIGALTIRIVARKRTIANILGAFVNLLTFSKFWI